MGITLTALHLRGDEELGTDLCACCVANLAVNVAALIPNYDERAVAQGGDVGHTLPINWVRVDEELVANFHPGRVENLRLNSARRGVALQPAEHKTAIAQSGNARRGMDLRLLYEDLGAPTFAPVTSKICTAMPLLSAL